MDICRDFAQNKCTRGTSCKYKHEKVGGGAAGGGNGGANSNGSGGGSGGANSRNAPQQNTAKTGAFPPGVWILNIAGEIRAYKHGCHGTKNKAEVEALLRKDSKSISQSEYSTTEPANLQTDFAWINQL